MKLILIFLVTITFSINSIAAPNNNSDSRIRHINIIASFDLDCPAEKIVVANLINLQYSAIGCNKGARYLLSYCQDKWEQSRCKVSIDGHVQIFNKHKQQD
jgi:hypothetical protein